ncbi:hypothetical protein AB0L74_10120 [Streptomyces sp. NPDC052020]|uniref:hypothetical protein n=1 Tax=Streptomyces sp. NPDC052020 TaxID=3155677 RepID=UPI0034403427
MHVQRTKHASKYTVVPNAILQHRRLSLTARGLLALLLSQPEHGAATVRELTEGCPEGQKRVGNAMAELQAEGYVICTRVQNARGHWSTSVTVFDVPQAPAPEPETPEPGCPRLRSLGINPFGEKTQGKNPPTPQVPEGDGQNGERGEEAPQSQELGRAAALLGRLKTAVPALTLSTSDIAALAPVAAQWLERGATELQLRNELTEGLPTVIKSPRALLADRLTRKMPAAPVEVELLVECAECGRYLPRGQKAGICSECVGVAPTMPEPASVGQTEEAASLLSEIRQRRATGRIKGTSRRGFATV